MGKAAMHVKDCDCIDASRLGGPIVTDPLCAALDGGPRPTERVSGVDELVAFVRRCLDEDERMAQAAAELAETADWWASAEGKVNDANAPGYRNLLGGEHAWSLDEIGEHIARWDPARVLAEVEAKRRILDAGAPRREREETGEYLHFGNWSSCSDDCAGTVWWEILKLLAQPYAGQDGWQEEWAQ
jgi:hypothetical protein